MERYTLKLDASWRPIEIIDGFKGFNMCFTGRANVVLNYDDGFFPAVIVLKSYVRKNLCLMHATGKMLYGETKMFVNIVETDFVFLN